MSVRWDLGNILLILGLALAVSAQAPAQEETDSDEFQFLFADPVPDDAGDASASTERQRTAKPEESRKQATDSSSADQENAQQLTTIPVNEQPEIQPRESGPPQPTRVLEEIVVTAQKRSQSLLEVPVSVSVISGDFVSDAGLRELADVAAYLPNVRFEPDPGGSLVLIRGIGTSTDNEGFEPSVGLLVDEVYFGRANYFTDAMYDIERVELLRGPQGTLFGKNTIAGVFNVTRKAPSADWSANLSSIGGQRGERRFEGGFGGPISDTLQFRVAGLEW